MCQIDIFTVTVPKSRTVKEKNRIVQAFFEITGPIPFECFFLSFAVPETRNRLRVSHNTKTLIPSYVVPRALMRLMQCMHGVWGDYQVPLTRARESSQPNA